MRHNANTPVYAYTGQKRTASAFLFCFLPDSLKRGISLNQKLTILARPVGGGALRFYLILPLNAWITGKSCHAWWFYKGSRNASSCPMVWEISGLSHWCISSTLYSFLQNSIYCFIEALTHNINEFYKEWDDGIISVNMVTHQKSYVSEARRDRRECHQAF